MLPCLPQVNMDLIFDVACCRFPRLNTLDLNQNTITGPLPGNWSAGFPSLLNLVLGHNGLTGANTVIKHD